MINKTMKNIIKIIFITMFFLIFSCTDRQESDKYYQEGINLYNSGEYSESGRVLQSALNKNRSNYDAALLLVHIKYVLNDYSGLKEYSDLCQGSGRHYYEACLIKVRYYINIKKYDKGREILASLKNDYPDTPAGEILSSELFLAEGRLSDALNETQRVINMAVFMKRAHDVNVEIYNTLGLTIKAAIEKDASSALKKNMELLNL